MPQTGVPSITMDNPDGIRPVSPRVGDKVMISVDDTALLQENGGEQLRAQSMSRLHTLNPSDARDDGLNKWPSFPHLGHGGSLNDARTYSTTNLYTDSMSPRVSMDNLTIGDDEPDHSRLSLLDCGGGGLTRSTSAKAMDSLPPLDPSQQRHSHAGNFLSPTVGADDIVLVSRSTSCPSMANVPKLRSPSNSPKNPSSPKRRLLPYPPERDVNLEGEVIQDLPIEPGQNFPDFFPEEGGPGVKDRAGSAEKPMHTRRVKEKISVENPVPTVRHNGETRNKGSSGKKKDGSGVVNIGDIPTSLAQRVISEHDIYRPEVDDKVKQKCLRWLNSLDNDH